MIKKITAAARAAWAPDAADPLADLRQAAGKAADAAAKARANHQTALSQLTSCQQQLADLHVQMTDADARRDFQEIATLKAKIAVTEEAARCYEADRAAAQRIVENTRTASGKADRKFFQALFENEIDGLRPALIRLTAAYRLAHKGDPVRDAWHALAVREALRLQDVRDADTLAAADQLCKVELGR